VRLSVPTPPPLATTSHRGTSVTQGVANLFDRQDRMAAYGPTFCDITWGAGGSTADLTLDIAAKMQNLVQFYTLLACRHLLLWSNCTSGGLPYGSSRYGRAHEGLALRSAWRP